VPRFASVARRATWLLGPAVAAFLVANLVDWTWHLAGASAVFALALGGLLGADEGRARPTMRTSRTLPVRR
jgi:hypothetical protein